MISRASIKWHCKQNVEDINTVLKYIDYFDYPFSDKKMDKMKKKLEESKEKLEKKIEEDDFDD